MAHTKKPEGLCEKIHSAVSPFQPRARRISDQPRSSVSNPVEISSKPVHVLHRSETVPVELKHARVSAQNNKIEPGEREILIVRGQKFGKSGSSSRGEDAGQHVHFVKARSKKEDDHHHEGRFSDYISKFKNRMIKTASNVGVNGGSGGGGGGGGDSGRRDSFNDKVTSYIDRARVKIRTTSNVGVDDQNKIKKFEK